MGMRISRRSLLALSMGQSVAAPTPRRVGLICTRAWRHFVPHFHHLLGLWPKSTSFHFSIPEEEPPYDKIREAFDGMIARGYTFSIDTIGTQQELQEKQPGWADLPPHYTQVLGGRWNRDSRSLRMGLASAEVRFAVDTHAVSGAAAYAMQHPWPNEAVDTMLSRLPGLFDDCFLAALRATPAPRPLLVEIRGLLPLLAWNVFQAALKRHSLEVVPVDERLLREASRP